MENRTWKTWRNLENRQGNSRNDHLLNYIALVRVALIEGFYELQIALQNRNLFVSF